MSSFRKPNEIEAEVVSICKDNDISQDVLYKLRLCMIEYKNAILQRFSERENPRF